jgi:hypothetical protein
MMANEFVFFHSSQAGTMDVKIAFEIRNPRLEKSPQLGTHAWKTHAPSGRNITTIFEKQRMFISCPDSVAWGQSFELVVHFPSVKGDCDRAAQRNPAQHPISCLR